MCNLWVDANGLYSDATIFYEGFSISGVGVPVVPEPAPSGKGEEQLYLLWVLSGVP